MKLGDLERAVHEADRFLRAARLALKGTTINDVYTQPGARSAAVKRASLDLSKALAAIRRST